MGLCVPFAQGGLPSSNSALLRAPNGSVILNYCTCCLENLLPTRSSNADGNASLQVDVFVSLPANHKWKCTILCLARNLLTCLLICDYLVSKIGFERRSFNCPNYYGFSHRQQFVQSKDCLMRDRHAEKKGRNSAAIEVQSNSLVGILDSAPVHSKTFWFAS